MMPRLTMLVLMFTVTGAVSAPDVLSPGPKLLESTDTKTIDFITQIKPIFAARCYQCHGPEKQKGKLRLDRRSAVLKDQEKDLVIKPGAPKESRLYQLISLPAGDDDIMPAEGDPLTQDQIQLIHDWIQQGADWPPEVEASEPADEDPFKLPLLDEAQRAVEEESLAALGEHGVFAKRVASKTIAVEVNCSPMGDRFGDAEIQALKGLEPTLVWLNLAGTQVTDGGLSILKGFKQLRRLHLERTGISDSALVHLAPLSNLEYLNLYGTNVSVAGLENLVGLKKLRSLYLGQTPAATTVPKRLVAAPTLPKWLKLTVNGNGTTVLTGTPGQDDVGEHTVRLQVRDEEGATAQQSFTIRVARFNKPPVFTSKPVIEAMEDATYSYLIQTTDPDDPLAQLQVRLGNVSINTGASESNPTQAQATEQQSSP